MSGGNINTHHASYARTVYSWAPEKSPVPLNKKLYWCPKVMHWLIEKCHCEL